VLLEIPKYTGFIQVKVTVNCLLVSYSLKLQNPSSFNDNVFLLFASTVLQFCDLGLKKENVMAKMAL